MEKLEGVFPVLRKIAIITLIGMLVMLLAGPALTVAGILLPFAIVGLLVWIPFRGFMLWREGGFTAVGQATRTGMGRIFAVPIWIVSKLFGAVHWVLSTVFGVVGFVLGLILPTLLGAVGGGVLGFIGGKEHQDADFRVPAGVLIGAAIGLLAGAMRSRHPKTIVVIKHVPQELRHA